MFLFHDMSLYDTVIYTFLFWDSELTSRSKAATSSISCIHRWARRGSPALKRAKITWAFQWDPMGLQLQTSSNYMLLRAGVSHSYGWFMFYPRGIQHGLKMDHLSDFPTWKPPFSSGMCQPCLRKPEDIQKIRFHEGFIDSIKLTHVKLEMETREWSLQIQRWWIWPSRGLSAVLEMSLSKKIGFLSAKG